MKTLWELLGERGLTARVVFDTGIRQLLEKATPTVDPAAGLDDISGQLNLGIAEAPLPGISLNFKPPLGEFDYHLVFAGGNPASDFHLWIPLDTLAGAVRPEGAALFEFIGGLPGHVLNAATYKTDADGREWLEAVEPATPAKVTGLRISLLIAGAAGAQASMKLSPSDGGTESVVVLKLDPPTVLIGASGFGFQLPDDVPGGEPLGIVIDDSSVAAPPGVTVIDGNPVVTPADDPAWRGIAIRKLRFFLPEKIPYFGAHAIDAYLQIGFEPPGIDLAIVSKVPATADRPGLDVRIECRDPTARGLTGFAPTLVEVAMTLPFDKEQHADVSGKGLDFVAGTPVTARARFSRLPTEATSTLTLALESQGPDGIVAVHAPEGGAAARVMIAAAALATAIVADSPPAGADASGVALHALLVAALGASAFLKDKGKVVVHAVELESSGHGLPVGDAVKLRIDYSVDVVVRPIDVGVLSVSLRDEQPMRVRNRHVGLSFDPAASGLDKFKLDFSAADMEIEDPGSWQVQGPASLFDILGTRSGRGSMWLEVDLRFKLNLGPVRISGATIRATLDTASGAIKATLEGLDAGIKVPAVLDGKGKLQLLAGGGFEADIAVNVIPLNLAASATVLYAEVAGGGWWLFLRLAVDLPGPLPLANSGVGIYGLAGSFGVNARPTSPPPDSPDPVAWQLAWDSSDPLTAFGYAPDQLTIGAEAVVGTVADMGFGFSVKGGVFVTVPDVAVRAALMGRVMSPRLLVTERPAPAAVGLSFKGVAVIDPADGVTIGLKGELNVPVLMRAVVPLGAHFPVKGPDDWYVYLGADGYPTQGRALGPMRVDVLPDLYPQHADAYVMLRGRGIEKWPRGGGLTITDGFVIAFGFAVEMSIGPRPIAWAEVHGGVDILIATNPLTLAGFGFIGGSLHLGPFSIGVDAQLAFIVPDGAPSWVKARVCGHIDLFFTEIEGCAEISVGDKPTRALPPPSVHPLDAVEGEAIVGDLAWLIDGHYARVAALARVAADAPTVWPDTLIHLAFGTTPKAGAGISGGQFDDAALTMPAAQPLGSDMLRYEWTLTALELFDVTDSDAGSKLAPAAPLSAAWQKGKAGALGTDPQAGELVLLTYDGAMWLDRLADGGAGLPASPLDDPATACQATVAAQTGWAVGVGALADVPGMRLPSDPISPNPCVSRFTARITTTCNLLPGVALGAATANLLPVPLRFTPLRAGIATPPLQLTRTVGGTEVPEREFSGWLQLGYVTMPGLMENAPWLKRMQPWNVAELLPSVPLTAPRVWIAVDGAKAAAGAQAAMVNSAGGDWIAGPPIALPDGRAALCFEPPFAAMVTSITLAWPVNSALALIGLGGLTQAAIDAAAALNKSIQDAAQKLADAAAKKPQPPDASTGKDVRCLLTPGRSYRLDVDLRWQGWLYEQDEAGKKVEVAQPAPGAGDPPAGSTYQPRNGPAQSTKRSYFFKTAPVVTPPAAGDPVVFAIPAYGEVGRVNTLLRQQKFFEPALLQRHLLGYSPAQSETTRFADDPVGAHFGADHVAALAKVYGMDLRLGLRRVDVPDMPDAVPNPGALLSLDTAWLALEAPDLLAPADKLKFDRAGAGICAQPKPGATLKSGPLALATYAWHEVYVQVTRKVGGKDVEAGRLPGVTFRTSRWRNPRALLDGIGFRAFGGVRVTGDIALDALPALAPASVEGEDAAYEDALAALGLDGWPPADTAPRASQLWIPGEVDGAPGWLCAGLLLEAPEPIHRPDRLEILTLGAVMRADGVSAVSFDLRRRDRGGSRQLWLTSTPFVPRQWAFVDGEALMLDPMFVLTLDDIGAAAIAGAMTMNLQPAFADEV